MNINNSIRTIMLIFVLLFPLLLQASDLETRFNEGNAAYSVGKYDKAITIYKEIQKQEGSGSGLLYNLANSYAQKGEIGLAILNYERALKLSPTDPDILGNLAKVRKDKGLFTEEPGKIQRVFTVLSVDRWTSIAFGCLIFIIIVLFVRLKLGFSSRSLNVSSTCAVCLLALSVFATVFNYKTYNPMVVIARDVKLQVSPFEGATLTGAIEEGRLLFPVKQHGDYRYVVDRSGRKGWLRKESVKAVCL